MLKIIDLGNFFRPSLARERKSVRVGESQRDWERKKGRERGKYHCCSTAQPNPCFQFNSRYIDHFFHRSPCFEYRIFPIEFFIFRLEISQNSNTQRLTHTNTVVHRARCEKLCVCILNSIQAICSCWTISQSHTHSCTWMKRRSEFNREWERAREKRRDSRHENEKLALWWWESSCVVVCLWFKGARIAATHRHRVRPVVVCVCVRACLQVSPSAMHVWVWVWVFVPCDCVVCLLVGVCVCVNCDMNKFMRACVCMWN